MDKDLVQDQKIEQLTEHAKDNRTTDNAQWVVLFGGLLFLALYMNLIMGSVIRAQSAALQEAVHRCGK